MTAVAAQQSLFDWEDAPTAPEPAAEPQEWTTREMDALRAALDSHTPRRQTNAARLETVLIGLSEASGVHLRYLNYASESLVHLQTPEGAETWGDSTEEMRDKWTREVRERGAHVEWYRALACKADACGLPLEMRLAVDQMSPPSHVALSNDADPEFISADGSIRALLPAFRAIEVGGVTGRLRSTLAEAQADVAAIIADGARPEDVIVATPYPGWAEDMADAKDPDRMWTTRICCADPVTGRLWMAPKDIGSRMMHTEIAWPGAVYQDEPEQVRRHMEWAARKLAE